MQLLDGLMRIVSSDAEMRNQYYYAEFRQGQSRIQQYATPPLQRIEQIKQQNNARKKPAPVSQSLSSSDQLTIQLIDSLLEAMLNIPSPLLSLADLNKQLSQHTANAQMWQHIAESLQDMLMPTRYPRNHFATNGITLRPQLEVVYGDNTAINIDTEIKLSAIWLNILDQLQMSDSLKNIPRLIQLHTTALPPLQYISSLAVDLNLENMPVITEKAKEPPERIKPLLNHLRIWSGNEEEQHKLLAMGIEDIGIIYLGHIHAEQILQAGNYQYYAENICNHPQIDCIV